MVLCARHPPGMSGKEAGGRLGGGKVDVEAEEEHRGFKISIVMMRGTFCLMLRADDVYAPVQV